MVRHNEMHREAELLQNIITRLMRCFFFLKHFYTSYLIVSLIPFAAVDAVLAGAGNFPALQAPAVKEPRPNIPHGRYATSMQHGLSNKKAPHTYTNTTRTCITCTSHDAP